MPSTIRTIVAIRQKVSFRRIRRRSTMKSASSDIVFIPDSAFYPNSALPVCSAGPLFRFFVVAGFAFFALALERGSENVAQSRPGIRRPILGDRFLLFRHLQRLDRDRHPARAAVELGDAGIDLLADREAIGTLLGTVARELGAFHEGGII